MLASCAVCARTRLLRHQAVRAASGSIRSRARAASLLDVSSTATKEELKAAYVKKAKLVHPDTSEEVDGRRFHALREAFEQLSDGAAVAQELELSELQIYKQEIRQALKQKDGAVMQLDTLQIWGAIQADHRGRVLKLDGDLLSLLVDLAACSENLPIALQILKEADDLKRIAHDDVLQAYNCLLSYCEYSLRKQVETGVFLADDTHERTLTMHEVIESFQTQQINPDVQTHMIMSRNSRRLQWLCA